VIENSLELFFDILLSPDLPLIVILTSDFPHFYPSINQFFLFLVSFLKWRDIFGLDIFLVVHDHLIVLI